MPVTQSVICTTRMHIVTTFNDIKLYYSNVLKHVYLTNSEEKI